MKKTLGTLLLALTLLTAPSAFAAQPPNTFFAGPCSGSASKTPGFRILCANDLAALAPSYGGISLQGSTPGTANTGNEHITGTIIADTGFSGPLLTLPIQADSLLSETGAVNLNTATATLLYTCPSGKTCVVTKVVVRNASTSLTTASLSFGWESSTFANVIANATHTELTGSTLYSVLAAKAGATVGASTGTFKVLANTLQGGAATATVDVFGFIF